MVYCEGDKLTPTGRVRRGIVLDNERPVYIKPCCYPQAIKNIIKEQIREMLKQGIIRKSSSTFNSPMWEVPKDAWENLGRATSLTESDLSIRKFQKDRQRETRHTNSKGY